MGGGGGGVEPLIIYDFLKIDQNLMKHLKINKNSLLVTFSAGGQYRSSE